MNNLKTTQEKFIDIIDTIKFNEIIKGKRPTNFLKSNDNTLFSVDYGTYAEKVYLTENFKTEIFKSNYTYNSDLINLFKSKKYFYYIERSDKKGIEAINFLTFEEFDEMDNYLIDDLLYLTMKNKKMKLTQHQKVFLKMRFEYKSNDDINKMVEQFYIDQEIKNF